jgi:hypothetical protein
MVLQNREASRCYEVVAFLEASAHCASLRTEIDLLSKAIDREASALRETQELLRQRSFENQRLYQEVFLEEECSQCSMID